MAVTEYVSCTENVIICAAEGAEISVILVHECSDMGYTCSIFYRHKSSLISHTQINVLVLTCQLFELLFTFCDENCSM